MASLAISNSELYANLAMVMGINRDSTLWDQTTADDVSRIIRAGRRKVFSAHDWSFLHTYFDTETIAPQTTGTVEIVAGVVTLTGATFPSTSAGQRLIVGSSVLEIASYDSATQVTLVDTSATAAAGTTYKLYHTRYPLPANFSAFVSPVTIENSREFLDLREMAVLPEFHVRGLNSRSTALADRPAAFAVFQDTNSETGIPTYYLDLYPLPDAAYAVKSVIRINPGDALAEVSDVFHSSFAELVQTAVLSAAEIMYNGQPGIHTQLYAATLPDYIRRDKMSHGARRFLPRTDGSRMDRRGQRRLDISVNVDAGAI